MRHPTMSLRILRKRSYSLRGRLPHLRPWPSRDRIQNLSGREPSLQAKRAAGQPFNLHLSPRTPRAKRAQPTRATRWTESQGVNLWITSPPLHSKLAAPSSVPNNAKKSRTDCPWWTLATYKTIKVNNKARREQSITVNWSSQRRLGKWSRAIKSKRMRSL